MSKNKGVTTITKPNSKEIIAKERLDKLHDKKAKIQSDMSFHATTEDNAITLHPKFDSNTKLSHQQQIEQSQAELCSATGTASTKYGNLILSQTITGFFNAKNDIATTTQAVNEALLAMNPADEFEGMLCSRLLVLHNQYMNFMTKSATSYHDAIVDLNINRATKLIRLYNETLDTLNKYRRKGEQRIVIQHVNVNDGGQAVIAGEMVRGRDNLKNHKE